MGCGVSVSEPPQTTTFMPSSGVMKPGRSRRARGPLVAWPSAPTASVTRADDQLLVVTNAMRVVPHVLRVETRSPHLDLDGVRANVAVSLLSDDEHAAAP